MVILKFSTKGSSGAVFVIWGTGVAMVDTAFFGVEFLVTLGITVVLGFVVDIGDLVTTEVAAVVGSTTAGVGEGADAEKGVLFMHPAVKITAVHSKKHSKKRNIRE